MTRPATRFGQIHRILPWSFMVVIGVVLMPRWLHRAFAWTIGTAIFYFWPSMRDTIHQNLRRVFPHAKPERLRTLTLQTFVNYGSYLFDLMVLSGPTERFRGLLGKMPGRTAFRELLEDGRGVIVVTPHLGLWEFGGITFSEDGYKIAAIQQKDAGDATFRRFRDRMRKQRNIDILWMDPEETNNFLLLDALRVLQAGGILALLPDRHTGDRFVDVDLFGAPTRFPLGPAVLAHAANVPIVPVWVPLDIETLRYTPIVGRPINVARTGNRNEAIQRATQDMARSFESAIRAHPDQWYLFKDIWK